MTLSTEGGNLRRSLRPSLTGVPTRPQGARVNDRQWALSLSASM